MGCSTGIGLSTSIGASALSALECDIAVRTFAYSLRVWSK